MISRKEWTNTVLRNVYIERINECIKVLKDCKDNGLQYPDNVFQEYKRLELVLDTWDFS